MGPEKIFIFEQAHEKGVLTNKSQIVYNHFHGVKAEQLDGRMVVWGREREISLSRVFAVDSGAVR